MKPLVLVLAGYDPSGRAGVLLDRMVAAALGAEVLSVVTADTEQDQTPVKVIPWEPELIKAQVESVLEGRLPDAVKIGMVPDAGVAAAISRMISSGMLGSFIVHDPVLATGSGSPLWLGGPDIQPLIEISRRSTIVTPNVVEAMAYLEEPAHLLSTMQAMARAVALRLGGTSERNLLLKGGHDDLLRPSTLKVHTPDTITDILYTSSGRNPVELTAVRLPVRLRGTGCFMSSAIAALAAHGLGIGEAVTLAHTLMAEAFADAHETIHDEEGSDGGPIEPMAIPSGPEERWRVHAALIAADTSRVKETL